MARHTEFQAKNQMNKNWWFWYGNITIYLIIIVLLMGMIIFIQL